ncbi:hypothetical protein KSD_48970 [Ktedonobacter sp. SOSP1-85]|uniref:YwqG family protein n=1 Tax=Ktedonobacter sp. SOSP1-85 TaxID=2778367 RepID=UPI0019167673|nr:YwqG family protein [Ktedonobacter sp. SOSP1-85]GHO77126.1 hypothetical protein KSD_48970 [Ktedonobacter sp. SOSP1-85]
MDTSEVQKLFISAGLGRLTKDLDALVKPSIRLEVTPAEEATLQPGVSKFGGLPDLPADVSWPTWQRLPQSFIAQFRLQDVHPYDAAGVLPTQGMLWFFYDAQQETYGDDPANRGGWSVIYRKDAQRLKRATVPAKLPKSSLFKAGSVQFIRELTLSQVPNLEIAKYDWSEDEQQKYDDLLANLLPQEKRAFRHRLLGNPDLIQDDLREQSQLISHGVTEDNDPRQKQLEEGVKAWQLLFQVDTDERLGMRWSSAGMLYYTITDADLRAQHFENTWLILQAD